MNQANLKPKKWYDKVWLVVLLCILFAPVGLYGLWKNNSLSKGVKWGGTALIIILIFVKLGTMDVNTSAMANTDGATTETTNSQPSAPQPVTVGQVLHTTYFDVTVNKVQLMNEVNTGNPYTDLAPEKDNEFIVMNVSFKNTDNESRMITDGEIWINYNGKQYKFDKPETIMLDGWGVLLDQLNPLVTKTTNLVYKIPKEIKGNAYFQPGRSSRDELIYLGTL